MKNETMQLNSVIYKVGRNYLTQIVNSGTIKERKERIYISKEQRQELLDILNGDGLDTSKHQQIGRFFEQ
jgi:hypothetical protein